MLKNILNLEGAQLLSKKTLKAINGGNMELEDSSDDSEGKVCNPKCSQPYCCIKGQCVMCGYSITDAD